MKRPTDALTYVWRLADEDLYKSLKAGEFCHILEFPANGQVELAGTGDAKVLREGFSCVLIDLTAISTADMTPE